MTEVGKFLGYIGATVADVEKQRVKMYLFYWDAFLTFWVTTQVVLDCEATFALRFAVFILTRIFLILLIARGRTSK